MFSAWDRLPITHKTKPKRKQLTHDKTLVDRVAETLAPIMPVTGYDRERGTITVRSISNNDVVHEIHFKRVQ